MLSILKNNPKNEEEEEEEEDRYVVGSDTAYNEDTDEEILKESDIGAVCFMLTNNILYKIR